MSRFSSTSLLPKADKQTEDLVKRLDANLDRTRASSQNDPFSNSVLLSALDISRSLGDRSLADGTLDKLCHRLCLRAAAMRVEHARHYLAPLAPATNLAAAEKLFATADFAELKRRVATPCWGLVFTAHPTFALSKAALLALAELTTMRAASPAATEPLQTLAMAPHTERPNLDDEHHLSLIATANARSAYKKLVLRLFQWAARRWGQKAAELHPNFMTIASWVGYDTDGRVDITWRQTFHKRMLAAESQLVYYRERLRGIKGALPSLAKSAARLGETLDHLRAEMPSFAAERGDIAEVSRTMHRSLPDRLTDPEELTTAIEEALGKVGGNELLRNELLTLRSEVETFGIGCSHTHMRLNASQLHNALTDELKLEGDSQNWNSAISIRRLNDLLESVKARKINFGSLISERTSAKRLFMIIRQILRYIDRKTPIRLLIAECESPLDLLAALYLAKLFGVEDRIDICPLFETEIALAKGHRIIATAVQNPQFRAYLNRRKVLTVETGWSDAGRHIGQCAAALSIENLHMNLARTVKAQKLHRLQLVIFDTHGESIGRGGHPKTMKDRFAYLASPFSRKLFADLAIATKREVSFQGGDGYAWFMNEETALAAVCRGLEYFGSPPPKAVRDEFYKEAEYAAEFTEAIKTFNKNVMNQSGYALLLGAFGSRLAGFAGSRPEIRHSDGPPTYERVANMRAIPQNAALQQMGYMANSLGGLGAAHIMDEAKAMRMEALSPRFRSLIDIPRYALGFSDIELFAAYAAILDPGMWLARAARSSVTSRRRAMRKIYRLLEDWAMWSKIAPTVRLFRRDYDEVRSWLLHGEGVSVVGGGRVIPKPLRDELLLIHALRIALIHEIFILAAEIPEFNYQFAHSYEDLIQRFMCLDCDGAVEVLREIFPSTEIGDHRDYGEVSDYKDKKTGYRRLHERVTEPILKKTAQVRLLGQAVINFLGAYG